MPDFGGFETEKYTANGTPLLTAPAPPRKPPAGLLGPEPRDAAVDDLTGDVWVADAWAQRFDRFSSTGALIGTWGERGPGGPFNMNYPRSIAIDPVSRRIWLANERDTISRSTTTRRATPRLRPTRRRLRPDRQRRYRPGSLPLAGRHRVLHADRRHTRRHHR